MLQLQKQMNTDKQQGMLDKECKLNQKTTDLNLQTAEQQELSWLDAVLGGTNPSS